ncbi:MAG: hypothetical protein LBL98_02035 [Ruminococcus sp.]|jgi:hypothetical protein|nr:hypothetical protein [Ruminococcus sp.]
MKKAIRKGLTCLFTVILAVLALSLPIGAAEDSTFAFDNEIGADLWKIDNEELAAKSSIAYRVTDKQVYDGAGALGVSESFTGDIDTALVGGAYIAASDVGLTDFAGCTITAQIYPTAEAIARGGQFIIYTDGMLYLPVAQTSFTANAWNEIALTVPENCQNTRLGFLTPVYSTFSGDAFFLDEIKITLPDGSTVPNVGDYAAPATGVAAGIADWIAVIIYVALGILGVGIIVFVIYLVINFKKRYR